MEEDNQNLIMILKSATGEAIKVDVFPNDTVRMLKERIQAEAGIPVDFNQLEIPGKELEDDTNIIEYFAETPNDEMLEGEDALQTVLGLAKDDDTEVDVKPDIADTLFCAAMGCKSNKLLTPDIPLFRFPAQKKRCLQWLHAANRQDLANQSLGYLNHNLVLCQNHFDRNQFATKDRRVLKQNAVPSLFDSDAGESSSAVISAIDIGAGSLLETLLGTGENNVGAGLTEEEEDEDMEEEPPEHPGSLCRLCANPLRETDPIFIFSEDGEKNCLAEKINASLPISVRKTDPLPKQICATCSARLEINHKFAEACIKAELKLKNLTRKFLVHQLKDSRRSRSLQRPLGCPLCCHGDMAFLGNDEESQSRNVIRLKKDSAEDVPDLPTGLLPVAKFEPEDASHDFINDLYSDDEDDLSDCEGGSGPEEGKEKTDVSDSLYLQEDKVEMTYSCSLCEEHFVSACECLDHCKMHCTSEDYPCLVCGLAFPSEPELREHFTEHKQKIASIRRTPCKPMLGCGACRSKFSTKKDFILHKCSKPVLTVTHNDSQDTYCELCDKHFKSSERAALHRSYHAGTPKMQCGSCDAELETEKALTYHTVFQHENTALPQCSHCELRFYSHELRDKHERIHELTTYQCSLCNKTFRDLATVTSHVEDHGTTTTLQCPKCELQFTKRSHYSHHMENAHDGDLNNMKRMPSLIQYQCKICSDRFTSSQDVIIHRTVHWKSLDPLLPHVCEYCGEPHASPNALARHRRILHPEEHPYVCTLCENRTRTLYEARVHRKTHTGYVTTPHKTQTKIYQCEHCPSLFSDKASFLSHKKSHKLSKGFQCEFCNKTFPERHRLIVHRRQHTGEKPFSCGVCGKMFAQTSAMYTHALLHTGETPHACDLCGRKFRIKSDRDNHRRTHTGEKPYKCQFCDKSFRTGQVYYQHRMIHTGERRFSCDICGRAFKRSHTLVCHRRIHTGEKPNICDVCGKGFRQRTDMRKHKMNLHGVA